MTDLKEPLEDPPPLEEKPKANRFLWGILGLSLLILALSLQWILSYASNHWLEKIKKTSMSNEEIVQKPMSFLKAPVIDAGVNSSLSIINPEPLRVDEQKVEAHHKLEDTLAKMRLIERLKEQEERQKKREEMLESEGFLAIGVSLNSSKNEPTSSSSSSQNPNTQYMNSLSNQGVHEMTAEQLGDLRYRILKGAILQGVTESAIDSDLPNTIRAHVTEDVFGEQSDEPLIHNGDKLVGEYRSGDIRAGQVRLYVVWTRLIVQNGYSINLDSSGSDPLGRAGMSGPVDKHFLERYGSALLMSFISAGASVAGVNNNARYNSEAAFREHISESFSQTATNELQQNMAIQNTIRPPQGTPISIVVNNDLSFEAMFKSLEGTS